MINRVRTLLMNRGRDGYAMLAGEEYIPPDFVQRYQPVWLKRIYTSLFGASPDRLFINYRMRQLMEIIHASQLHEFVSETGDDLTYLPFRDDFNAAMFKRTVELPTDTTVSVHVYGEHAADEAAGRTTYNWSVQVVTPTIVRVTSHTPEVQSVEYPLTFTNGLSNAIPLVLNKVTTKFTTAPPGFVYTVQDVVRPARDITAVLHATFLDAEGMDETRVFDPTADENQRMYFDIWRKHPQAVMKYAAALISIANYTATQEAVD